MKDYETTLQLVRDLSEGRIKREPNFVYRPPKPSLVEQIIKPTPALPIVQTQPETEPKLPAYTWN